LEPLRIDLGCGPNKRPGFVGVDSLPFDGKVDVVCDLSAGRWPWDDNSVDEAHSSHFVEHLTAMQRVRFCNELYRVLKPGAGCQVIVPHWGSCRAYGDPTHQWPPVSEFWFYYLSKDWRAGNAPHTDAANITGGFNCDFDCTWGYSVHPTIQLKNQEAQQFAFGFYKEAIQDVIATLKKKA
jgi:SAM-dependent methyltransferase